MEPITNTEIAPSSDTGATQRQLDDIFDRSTETRQLPPTPVRDLQVEDSNRPETQDTLVQRKDTCTKQLHVSLKRLQDTNQPGCQDLVGSSSDRKRQKSLQLLQAEYKDALQEAESNLERHHRQGYEKLTEDMLTEDIVKQMSTSIRILEDCSEHLKAATVALGTALNKKAMITENAKIQKKTSQLCSKIEHIISQVEHRTQSYLSTSILNEHSLHLGSPNRQLPGIDSPRDSVQLTHQVEVHQPMNHASQERTIPSAQQRTHSGSREHSIHTEVTPVDQLSPSSDITALLTLMHQQQQQTQK